MTEFNLPTRRILKNILKDYNRDMGSNFNSFKEDAFHKAQRELASMGLYIETMRPFYYLLYKLPNLKGRTISRMGKAALKKHKLVSMNDLIHYHLYSLDMREIKFSRAKVEKKEEMY